MKKHFLASVICLSLLLLTACAGNLKNINVEMLAKSSISWDGQALPDYPKGKPEITILLQKSGTGL